MKKKICFAVCGVSYQVPMVFLCVLGLCFVAGTVFPGFIIFTVSDRLFSPFFLLGGSGGFIFLHSVLYNLLFPVVALVFATSFFGFAVFPLLAFFKGLFMGLCVQGLLTAGAFFSCYLIYAPLLTLEAAALLIYFSQSMAISLHFFKGQADSADCFSGSLRQFLTIAVFMTALALLGSLAQYFI